MGAIASPTTTTLALTSGTNPSNGGAALTFTATVTGGNAPTGSVMFYDGLTLIGTSTLNGSFQASFTTSTLSGGVHAITALYLGDAGNAPSASAALSQTVVKPAPATTTTLALTGGANPSNLGAAVTFTATVTGAAPTGSVTFYNGTAIARHRRLERLRPGQPHHQQPRRRLERHHGPLSGRCHQRAQRLGLALVPNRQSTGPATAS